MQSKRLSAISLVRMGLESGVTALES